MAEIPILTSRIPEILAEAEAKTAIVVQKTAHDIEAGCKVRSRVDTGEMRNAWAVETLGAEEALVYNPVEHSIFNEFGTVNMSAQPMLTPSVEEAREPFYEAMAGVYW
jgi:hypothetical protein